MVTDQHKHLENYELRFKLPKEKLNRLVRKEIEKSYPSFQDLKNMRDKMREMDKDMRKLNYKINELTKWVKLIEQAMEGPGEKVR